MCWTCHGMIGKGDGPNAEALKVHPADLGSPSVSTDQRRHLLEDHARSR
ncbi:MAG: hypothetical protein IPI00_12580 [Flavobacteriales bacterium]|nr:hypothetical protein [Flavobacteriales bacterium]